MSIAPQVFHHVPKPISFVEFFEAVRAATPPRFPDALRLSPRRVGLCISGGVDSMALAFLFNRLRLQDPSFRVADNLIKVKPQAFVINHKLRPESDAEVMAVMKQLGRFQCLQPQSAAINWRDELDIPLDTDPATLPGIESLARRFRYRRIGKQCEHGEIMSLFTAHHEDDQYETVLMRLLNGHGVRGLCGMRQGVNIPECHDLHGVYESGFVDDQMKPQPLISFYPRRKDWRYTRRDLRSEIDLATHMAELRAGLRAELGMAYIDRHYGDDLSKNRRPPPTAAPIDTEDGGVVVYRPLLGFSKDRLIATCEANKIPWFEDRTNSDPTFTLRNAVRHMVKNYQLPVALQKESVLQLSKRCVEKTKAEDQEVERWLSKITIHDFEPLAGTLVVTVPDLAVQRPSRRSIYNRSRRELRLSHRRTIAALMIRRLTAFVTPERTLPQISALQVSVSRVFPSIAPTAADAPKSESVPKAFNQASVLFIPLQTESSKALGGANPLRSPSPQKWFLTRQPYPSRKPPPAMSLATNADEPKVRFHFLDDPSLVPGSPKHLPGHDSATPDDHPMPLGRWYGWRKWEIFDGRFWFRLRARFKGSLRVAPFNEDFAKEFREGLDDEGRAKLASLLKRYAPGKVRYTLPALYAVNTPPPNVYYKEKDELARQRAAAEKNEEDVDDSGGGGGEPAGFQGKPRLRESYIQTWAGPKSDVKLLGMLTLPVHLPGLENWVQWDVRYKKVDVDLLERTCPVEPGPVLEQNVPSTGLRRRWRRKGARGRRGIIPDEDLEQTFDTHRYP